MLHKKNRLSQTAILHWKHGETLNYKTTLLLHFTCTYCSRQTDLAPQVAKANRGGPGTI